MAASIARKKALGIGITDAVAVLFILAVPALSHLTSVPFYLLDPMRLAVLGALLASRSRVNGLVLAVALPLVSFAISEHPVFPKFLVIAAELSVNVLLFSWLVKAFTARLSSSSGDGAAEDFARMTLIEPDSLSADVFMAQEAVRNIMLYQSPRCTRAASSVSIPS